ncbi:hypoxanthine phosphoribosyltransferase [Peptoniphilus asaccharolyticus]
MDIEKKKWEVLCSEEKLEDISKEVGAKISEDYKDKNLLVISILKGALFFTAELTKHITPVTKIDFMMTSSYGDGEINIGKVKVIKDIDYDLDGYDVLIVDDILDTGITMEFLVDHLKKKNPTSIKTCVMFNKQERRAADISADYIGMEIEDKFLVGYGLDFKDRYRNIPYVFCVLDEDK